MERFGSLDPEALTASEPEILFVLALAGLVHLLRTHLALLTHSNPIRALTVRELEVLAWVAGGKTNAETADLLSFAPGTVKKHLDHIYEKSVSARGPRRSLRRWESALCPGKSDRQTQLIGRSTRRTNGLGFA
jgi:DNA-binding CsgD family transcriptional regulator